MTLPVDQQRMLASAHAKRSNPEAAEICGEPMTEAERELLQSYHHRSEIEYPIIGAVRYGGDPGISVILDAYATMPRALIFLPPIWFVPTLGLKYDQAEGVVLGDEQAVHPIISMY